jgi:hypothetical protein
MTNYNSEIWRTIPDFPNYEISSYGRLRRISSRYFLKYNVDKDGYLRVSIRKTGRRNFCLHIHRLVAIAFLPKPRGPGKKQVNHKNGDKTNNHISNLEWVSCKKNISHAYQKLGYWPKPKKHSKETILKIHEMRMSGISPSQISKELGVGLSHVEQIIQRRVRARDLQDLPTNYPKLPKGFAFKRR